MNIITVELIDKYETWCDFYIYIKADDFSGGAGFSLNYSKLDLLIGDLENLYEKLEGAVLIQYDESDDYVEIKSTQYGHINISAQLGGSWNDNWVKLLMHTDQTVLKTIIDQFKQLRL